MKKMILKTILFYRRMFAGGNCRFVPSCSEYTYQAVVSYGTIKGLILGLKRIMRCHPFAKSGYDPVT